MTTTKIRLNTVGDIKDFVNIVTKYEFEVDLTSDRYVVDAKSIMGLYSLDLSKPVEVKIYSDDCQTFLDEIKNFIV